MKERKVKTWSELKVPPEELEPTWFRKVQVFRAPRRYWAHANSAPFSYTQEVLATVYFARPDQLGLPKSLTKGESRHLETRVTEYTYKKTISKHGSGKLVDVIRDPEDPEQVLRHRRCVELEAEATRWLHSNDPSVKRRKTA